MIHLCYFVQELEEIGATEPIQRVCNLTNKKEDKTILKKVPRGDLEELTNEFTPKIANTASNFKNI